MRTEGTGHGSRGAEKTDRKNVAIMFKAKKHSIVSLSVSRPFCPTVRTDIQAFRGSSIFFDLSVSSWMQSLFVYVHMFRGSRRAASGIQILALPVNTHGCSISTQVSQVRIEGTERRKGTAKKK